MNGPACDLPRDIAGLHGAYRAGLTPAAVLDSIERRIRRVADPGVFISRPDRPAIARFLAALGPFDPDRKPLWGIPFAVKDNIDLAGMDTTAACPAYAYRARESAFVVGRLMAAGAIPIGKTNLDQFATGLVGVRTPYPVPRNALDPALVPGGSSSGSAIAVAQGFCTFALGTDTAGSGRVPAGFNGIVGLKPSLGALSTRGVVPACRTLDCVSVFAASVADARAAFAHALAFDDADPHARPYAAPADQTVARIGVPRMADREFCGDDAARQGFTAALAALRRLGYGITEIPFGVFFETARLLYEGPWLAERYAAIESFIESQPDAMHPLTRAIIGPARSLGAVDAFKAMYRLKFLQREAGRLIAGVDALCVPTVPTWYSLTDVAADPIGTNARLGIYTNFVNLLGLSALTLPLPRQSDGRPGSITLIAADGRGGALAAAGARIRGERVPPGWP